MNLTIDDVRNSTCPIADATSVYELCHGRALRYLSAGSKERDGLDRAGVLTDIELRKALRLLERVVVYGSVWVDVKAIESLQDPDWGDPRPADIAWPTSVAFFEISGDTYDQVRRRVQADFDRIKQLDCLSWMVSENLDDRFDMEYQKFRRQGSMFADSSNDLYRALFYLQLAEVTQSPLFLSPTKDWWVNKIGDVLRSKTRDVFAKVVGRVDSSIRDPDPDGILDPPRFEGAPLGEFIIRYAHSFNCSIFHAAYEIANAPSAIQFRHRMSELVQLHRAGLSGQHQVRRLVTELGIEAKKWSNGLTSSLGVAATPVTVRLSAIPLIGWVFDLFDKGVVTKSMPDRILFGNTQFTFISDWYLSDDQLQRLRYPKLLAGKDRKSNA